jgi:hypothetical protein
MAKKNCSLPKINSFGSNVSSLPRSVVHLHSATARYLPQAWPAPDAVACFTVSRVMFARLTQFCLNLPLLCVTLLFIFDDQEYVGGTRLFYII